MMSAAFKFPRASFKTIFETLNQGILYYDLTGTIVELNRHAAKILKKKKKQLLGKTWKDIDIKVFNLDKKPLGISDFPSSQAIRNKKKASRKLFIELKDGSKKWVTISSIPVFDETKKLIGVYSVFDDITEDEERIVLLDSRVELQKSITELSSKALLHYPIDKLFQEACEEMHRILGVDFTKVLQLLPDGRRLLLRAGGGWKKSIKIGTDTIEGGLKSQAGYTLTARKPVIVVDLRIEKRFSGPNLLTDHDVRSGMSTILYGAEGEQWGVLGVHSKQVQRFTKDDIQYLQSVANILSFAIQQKQNWLELQQREQTFKTLTETMPQLVWIANGEGKTECFNQQWYTYANTPKLRLTHETWKKCFHPDDLKPTTEQWRQSIETGEIFEKEYRIKNGKTGEYRWFLGRALPLTDEEGKIVKWFGTATDIHIQKRSEAAEAFLSNASKFLSSSINYRETLPKVLQSAVPEISDWIVIDIVENSHSEFYHVAHKDRKKIKWAEKVRELYPPDYNDTSRGLGKVFATGKPEILNNITLEMMTRTIKDKKYLEVLEKVGFTAVMIVPIIQQGKTVGGLSFVSAESKNFFSQTDLQMAEELASRIALSKTNTELYEELQMKNKQFEALYEADIIGVCYSKLNGMVMSANDAFLKIIGYSHEELEKGTVSWVDITPQEYRNIDEKTNKSLLAKGVVSAYEKDYIHKDGRRVSVIIGKVLLSKKHEESLAFVLDISERKKLEQRKDEFLSVASHELKTPLTSVKGYVQILEKIIRQMGDDKLKTYIKKTHLYVERLNSLIEDLLDVSKIQAGKLQMNYSEHILKGVIDAGIDTIYPLNPNHKINAFGDLNIKIFVDKHRLEQVLTNLLTNAIKYSPGANKIEIHVNRKNNSVVVGVKDYGMGIEKDAIFKLFERFYRDEKMVKKISGLGIGLYISNQIIKRHGGTMWAEKNRGKGSTFYFSLPLKKELVQKAGKIIHYSP